MATFQAGAPAEDALIPVLSGVYRQQLQPVVRRWFPTIKLPEEINLTTLSGAVEQVAAATNRLPDFVPERERQIQINAFRKVQTSWTALAALTIQYEDDRTEGHPRHVLTWEAAARTVQRMTFQELPQFMRKFSASPARIPQVPKATREASAALTPTHDVNGERLPNPALRSNTKPKLGGPQKGLRYPPRSAAPQAAPER